ncbi:MAG TPA: peptide MFS transporter [Rhodanobacteraceae bacterium]|nr:peptide MFS transporter [Rhodanobacteraceae bacterium]
MNAIMNDGRNWFGQPRGLTILFLTEMWEQFSYYGMRALLVYYMTKQLMIGQQMSSLIYGTYTSMAFFTPIIGGIISDRWLGKRRAVIIGGSTMALGHFMMTFEPLFYPALATIALGNGLFLPSLPSQINDLYKPDDPRRGWAYNVYYVGINVGGFLAPLVCGFLGETYGWHWGFGAAGIGMLLGLVVYVAGGKYLPEQRRVPRAAVKAQAVRNGKATVMLLLGVGLAVTIFRGAYEQVGNTVALFADAGIDRATALMTIPMTWFQALNPMFVILMTPALLAWWSRRAKAGRDASSMQKMATGALIVAASYLLLAVAAWVAGSGQASWLWLLAYFVVYTLGELFILPTGLGLFARLAPPSMGATTVAAWFLAIFTGSMTAGIVGTLWSRMSHPVYFVLLAVIASLAAALLLALDRETRRIEGERAQEIAAAGLVVGGEAAA